MLKMLLPITLPIAISPCPVKADRRLTTSSGALVPKATTVSPITSGETRSAAATATAPRTSSSAPAVSTASPTPSHNQVIIDLSIGPGLRPRVGQS